MPKIFAVTAIILIISSCEVQESKNIYQRPDIPNLFNNQFNFVSYSQERIDKITKELSKLLNIHVNLNQKTFLNLEGNNISEFIDCGYMNDEIYVHYIERIFGTKLNIIVSFENFFHRDRYKIKNKNIEYTFTSKETGTRWRFETNKPKELLVGNPVYDENPYRTCLSKNVLESKIINIFNNSYNE
jgi:predicted secreted protein